MKGRWWEGTGTQVEGHLHTRECPRLPELGEAGNRLSLTVPGRNEPNTLISDVSLQNLEALPSVGGHPVCGALFWQPRPANTASLLLLSYVPMFPSVSQRVSWGPPSIESTLALLCAPFAGSVPGFPPPLTRVSRLLP